MFPFYQPSLPFKEFAKLSKFGIVGKWLPSGASLYNISLKRNNGSLKKWQWVTSTFYLKGLQSGFLVTWLLSDYEYKTFVSK